MCGRARCTLRPDGIPRACHRTQAPVRTINMDRYRPAYNVAPGYNLPVVRRGDGSDADGYVLHCMKWGLVPSFTKKTEKPDFYRMFNARSESLSEKASFRRLLPKNRCLVAVEGFYEWKKDGSKKQPYYIHFKDDRPLVFAALYDSWESSEGEILYTFTIATTSSSSALEWLHDRMPVILSDKESTDIWLSGSSSARFNTVLKPYEKADLAWYPVTPAMGKTSFDGPECIKEIQLKTEEKNPILKFFTRKGPKNEQKPNLQEKPSSDDLTKRELPKSVKEEPSKEIKEEEDSREEAHTALPKSVKEEPATGGDKEESTEKIKEHSREEGHTKLPKNVKEEPVIGGDKEESTEKIKEDSREEAHTKLPKSVKDGPAIGGDEKTHTQSHTREEDPDAKSGLSTLHTEDKGTCLGKRDYEKLTLTKSRNQVKRKGNRKGDGDKQPTLFSYMQKK